MAIGIVGIVIRRQFFAFALRWFARLYGQPVADHFEHSGTKSVALGGAVITAMGLTQVLISIFGSH
jgi:hypothetical protein